MRHLRRGERNGDCALDIAGTNEWFRLVTLLAERNISETENLDFSFLDLYVSCNTGKCGRVFVMIRIIYLSIAGVNSLQEISIPLFSILQWMGVDNVAAYLSYPLGILSVFELIYWILLSIFVSIYTQKNFWRSFYFVLSTYGTGLLLLVISMIYIVALIF